MALDIEELLRDTRTIGQSSPARKAEKLKRANLVNNMARTALVVLHRKDFDELVNQAKAKVNAERGPLPD